MAHANKKPAPPASELAIAYATSSLYELRKHYRVSAARLNQWLTEVGIPLRKAGGRVPRARPPHNLVCLTAEERALFQASGLTAMEVAARANMTLFDAQQVLRGRKVAPETAAAIVTALRPADAG